ncbi:uncharacterized protein N7511_004301 [Penicillium nucicola]|uniref:uncharacterized protein n=1 Tax=Penicillium nucicola TaxID=1850975 RepID=UPI002545AD18|nr:uncharacterized protein N7511_004301 [Penicillium nucicola]KAJ5766685.1 hypothetical protein N7511_004301 [Penicillium nucicola]
MGARFVVEDNSGRIRLMSSSATGGQLAIDGARAAGVPDTLRGEEALINLQRLVRAHFAGTYGLNWVAVGEVDPTHDKYPFMLVGFFFEGPNGNPPLMEVGLSRSALKKIISPREADRLISEALTYDSNVALEDAISGLAGLSIKSGGNPIGLPAAPQASLFGSNQHPTQQPAQPSLFGSNQRPQMQQPAQPSLFGSFQKPQMQQPTKPSLLGSNRPQVQQPAQASLFGSNQQPHMQPAYNQQPSAQSNEEL